MSAVADRIAEYHARREAALRRMDALGRGSRKDCSMDTRMHPSLVSNILRGSYENPEHLAIIERWLAGRDA